MQLGGWLDPQHLLNAFGLVGMGVIVFAESGLLIGLFLPGDSLLFTAGILVGALLWGAGLPIAGYALGRTIPSIDRYLLPRDRGHRGRLPAPPRP